jgi:hypothetical protein
MALHSATNRRPSVRLGAAEINVAKLEGELRRLRGIITRWAKEHDYWYDTGFQELGHQQMDAPQITEVLFLWSEGPLGVDAVLGAGNGECEHDFQKLLEKEGYAYELHANFTFRIFPESEDRQREFLALARWRWIQRLAQKRLYEIHTEVFEHFAKRPGDLRNLEWRQYEEFLDAVFKNQGYVTELGPGSNDGGVDLRLYQSAAVPEMVTLVQARRYTKKPIQLEAVAALYGHAVQQKAQKGILATTSYFQPKAETFAKSVERRVDLPSIELLDAKKTGGWCAEIAQHLEQYFETGANPPRHIAEQPPTELVGKVVVATGGHNMTINDFAVVETDFRHEVILRPIGSRITSGNEAQGSEVPAEDCAPKGVDGKRFTAFKTASTDPGGISFEGDRKHFFLWDGSPQSFDSFD